MNLNKVIIAGRVTKKPELKALPSGMEVASFSIATNLKFKNKDTGEDRESVEYHNIVFFGKQAITIAQYVEQGQVLLVEGRLQTRSWEGADGKKLYKTEIIGAIFQFGQRAGEGKSEGGNTTRPARTHSSQAPKRTKTAEEKKVDEDFNKFGGVDFPEEEINPEDIPF